MEKTEINFPESWQLMPYLLRLSETRSWERWELIDRVCQILNVSSAERIALAGRGKNSRTTVDIRIGQARQDLKKEGLIFYPEGKWIALTPKGKAFLCQNKEKNNDEMAYILSLLMGKKVQRPPLGEKPEKPFSPLLEAPIALKCITEKILTFLEAESPIFFEHLSLALVERMGYRFPAYKAYVTPKTGDGGLDGIVQFDELGHHITAMQSKRNAQTNKVGSDRIQAFKGAMIDRNIRNGVFLTTSDYTPAAKEVAEKQAHVRITLINGREFVAQMCQKEIGLVRDKTRDLFHIDREFFNTLRQQADL